MIYFSGFAIKIKREAYNYTKKLEDFVFTLWLAGEELAMSQGNNGSIRYDFVVL